LRIDDIVKCAHEIHRPRSGKFGCNFEVWLEAERELVDRNRPDNFEFEKLRTRDRFLGIKRIAVRKRF
jgi:hypothetical protein